MSAPWPAPRGRRAVAYVYQDGICDGPGYAWEGSPVANAVRLYLSEPGHAVAVGYPSNLYYVIQVFLCP